jgi:hypothetical protein
VLVLECRFYGIGLSFVDTVVSQALQGSSSGSQTPQAKIQIIPSQAAYLAILEGLEVDSVTWDVLTYI